MFTTELNENKSNCFNIVTAYYVAVVPITIEQERERYLQIRSRESGVNGRSLGM